ncbi:uncharacterized protein LOC135199470 isoform X2 [Macrobrachium nipponense]|uniref:uncharacterized protein LOC135199470 isoform X2 n=1 Tax=Macrobrachium nipponense TaxID=159736 RepID=UPI0030C81D86
MKSSRVVFLLTLGVVAWAVASEASPLDYKHIYDDDDYVAEEEEGEEVDGEEQPPEEGELGSSPLQEQPLAPPEQSPPLPFKEEEEYYGEEGEEEYRDREFGRSVYDKVTPPTRPSPTHDPLDDARSMAVLTIMERILVALGPSFVETLPKAPTNSTLATVPTPINITAEPCPYVYKRCSSQTSFPSCDIPHNTDPEVWAERFNLYFNLSTDFDKMDIINATLRLYKNNSIPLLHPKPLLVKAYAYTRSLTRKRSRTMLVAENSVSSDYTGWVTLSMDKIVRRWKKGRNNHGLLITVTDAHTVPWDASDIFIIMSCSSGLVPLPFEVQTDEVGQRYPALNIRQGSPNDDFPLTTVSRPPSSPRPPVPTEPHIQSDDPDVYDDEYDFSQMPSHRQSSSGSHPGMGHVERDHLTKMHGSHPRATGFHRDSPPSGFSFDSDVTHGDSLPVSGHGTRSGHKHSSRVTHGTPRRDMSDGPAFARAAATSHHDGSPHHSSSSVSHHQNPDHSQKASVEHHIESRHQITPAPLEDTLHTQYSEEQFLLGEPVTHTTTESSRPHRQRDSGSTKEYRHRRKHNHQRHGSSTATL